MSQPQKGSLVRIIWLDADDESGWQPHDPETDDKAEYLESFGLLVSQGKKFVTLSRTYNQDADEWLGKQRIPVSCIKTIETIEYASQEKDFSKEEA